MNYYLVSPNIYNDGNNYAQKMFTKGIAAVGWNTDSQKGQQFDSITQGDCIIVAQRINWQWTYYYMGIVLGNEDKPSYGTLSKRLSPIISLEGIDLNFEYWTANGSNQVPSPQRIDINSNINIIENINKIFNMQKYTDLLKSNHNLILTGAPGTGKTYLAKQIAKAMGCTDNEIGFVQFHPSYDYTDFVEGLRPAQDKSGNVGFVRKDGVFKAFCRKALKNVIDSKKTPQELKNEKTFKEKYYEIIGKIENGEIDRFDLRTGVQMDVVEVSEKDNIILRTHGSDKQYTVSFGRLSQLAKKFPDVASLNSITNIDKTIRDVIKGCHTSSYWAVLKAIYEQCSSDENEIVPNEVEEKKYVFIIDEINRGEISKIFGELFFSIDPGYRGIEGKVRTQYANMQTDPNVFDEALGINDSYNCGHFFVPENVYIIGTMNDIDRSVESMDFAFRRRFAFKEIKAIDRVEMLYDSENGIGNYADEAKERMNRLNKEIEKIEGLSTAYHIGPAYFLKLKNYNGDFQQLWDNHLEGLLCEYLRGMQNLEDKLKTLKAAYDNESDSDNGQQQE